MADHHSSRILLALLLTGCLPPLSDDDTGDDDTEDDDDAAGCDPTIGATAPLPTCTSDRPCLNPGPTDPRSEIVEPVQVPTCATSDGDRPFFDDGPPRAWTDTEGVARSACAFVPSGATPRPLLVFLHGAFGSADNVYDATSLRSKAEGFDLGRAGPGFVLLSVEGRNLHWPTSDPRDGAHHDTFHRDL